MIDFKLPGYQPSMNLSHSVAYTLSLLYNYPIQSGTNSDVLRVSKNSLYRYSEKIFKILGMDNFHNRDNLAVKRFKNIMDSKDLSQGDIDFFYKIFRNIERVANLK
jgi:tRNA C32,U32 (ribose-2'-O)-methylase TrmJ